MEPIKNQLYVQRRHKGHNGINGKINEVINLLHIFYDHKEELYCLIQVILDFTGFWSFYE